jgi:transposase
MSRLVASGISDALACRCRVVWAAAEGRSSIEIAERLGCDASTVGKWRVRFAERGLDGLQDEPRPGKPRTISDEQVERVIVKTLEEQPKDATHWSTRSMAQASGMSQSAVSRIWRAFGLKPQQTEACKLSPDPRFIDKVRDIVGLYLNPPEAAVVLCLDEKSQDPGARADGADPAADAGGGGATQATTTAEPASPTCTPPSIWPPGR